MFFHDSLFERRAFRAACCAATFFAGIAATAAEGPTGIGADDPAAGAPMGAYRSALEGFRTFAVEPPADWRKINDAVRETGGQAGALKAGEPSAQTELPTATPREAPPGGGHAGH